jgi:rSAM/selenodomain-associated transferase 2
VRFSIVIPILNEASLIGEFLGQLRKIAPAAEIIVVDGGSEDASARLALCQADHVLTTRPGRGGQMNAGAAIAQGDVIWFVHADSQVPPDACAAMERVLADAETVGGCFSLRIVPTRWVYRMRDAIGDVCVDRFGIALGDRGLFCRREIFNTLGGYAQEPLFEDADLYRRLGRAGTTRRLASTIQTSARRYEAQGPIRTCLFYGLVMLLYRLGLSRKKLRSLVFIFSNRFDPAGQKHASRPALAANDTEGVTTHPATFQLNPNL